MTRKDYVSMAAVLRAPYETGNARRVYSCGDDHAAIWQAGIRIAAEALAASFAADNPRFDRARFLMACGVTR